MLSNKRFLGNKSGIGFFVFLLLTSLTACSVHKAASNEGVSPSDIKNCKHRSALLAKGMEKIETQSRSDGKIIETYRAVCRKSGANYLRAAGHGVMDVMTLGLWEVVGTPVEGAISNNRHFVIAKATFANKYVDEIQNLEIFGPDGKKMDLSKHRKNNF